jgi:hypothetical protein
VFLLIINKVGVSVMSELVRVLKEMELEDLKEEREQGSLFEGISGPDAWSDWIDEFAQFLQEKQS